MTVFSDKEWSPERLMQHIWNGMIDSMGWASRLRSIRRTLEPHKYKICLRIPSSSKSVERRSLRRWSTANQSGSLRILGPTLFSTTLERRGALQWGMGCLDGWERPPAPLCTLTYFLLPSFYCLWSLLSLD